MSARKAANLQRNRPGKQNKQTEVSLQWQAEQWGSMEVTRGTTSGAGSLYRDVCSSLSSLGPLSFYTGANYYL